MSSSRQHVERPAARWDSLMMVSSGYTGGSKDSTQAFINASSPHSVPIAIAEQFSRHFHQDNFARKDGRTQREKMYQRLRRTDHV